MNRGYLKFLSDSPAYAGAEKKWLIELQQSNCFWYDLVVNPPEHADTRGMVSGLLSDARKQVMASLEKRFIYFFASRRKLRFDTNRPPRYSILKKQLIVNFLVGRIQKRVRVKRFIVDPSGRIATPRVDISDRFIRIWTDSESSQTYSVHDFAQVFAVRIGAPTQVHYVGVTSKPEERLLLRKHRGYADTIYQVSNEENDFFVYVNLFKVLSSASNHKHGMNFVVANANIDEISTDTEASIIEGVLIRYFRCQAQQVNQKQEESRLRNTLKRIAKGNGIHSVGMHIEIDQPNEYFEFGSDAVVAKPTHTFVCEVAADSLDVVSLESGEELASWARN